MIEKRREDVVIAPVNQRHLHRRARQGLGGLQTAEPTADDDNALQVTRHKLQVASYRAKSLTPPKTIRITTWATQAIAHTAKARGVAS